MTALVEVKNHLVKAIEAFDDIENKAIQLQQELNVLNRMDKRGNTFVFQLQLVNVNMVHNVFMALREVERVMDIDPSFTEIGTLDEMVEGLEIKLIRSAIQRTSTIADAARDLGIHRTTLQAKIKKHNGRGIDI